MKVDNAVILAAGRSQRFAPLTYEMPKGLFKVQGEVLIERQIEQLREAGVTDITIVVGYMKEKFFYLDEKYGVKFVINNTFNNKGNINSLYAVRDSLKNTYICCSDHYFVDNPFLEEPEHSYRATAYKEGEFREFAIDISNEGVITGFHIGKPDSLCMIGHAFFSESFSKKFVELMEREINDFGIQNMFWEEFYARHMTELTMFSKPYDLNNVLEFNSITDLRAFDKDFLLNINSDIVHNICNVLECGPNDIKNIEIIQKGLTNVSFKFDVFGKTYVYRHPGGSAENIINRESEVYSQNKAKELGIDKTLIHIDVAGWKISHFVDDTVETDLEHNDKQLAQVCEYLRILHSCEFETVRFFDCVDEAKRLIGLACKTKGNLFEEFKDIIADVDRLKELVVADNFPKVLSHGDIYSPNYLFTRSGEIYMIDWEFSSVADIANDVSGMVTRYDLDDAQVNRYLLAYFGRPLTFNEYRHYIGYFGIDSLYWLSWGLFKGSIFEDDGFFMLDAYKNCKRFCKAAFEMYEHPERFENWEFGK